jgi:hypothetical protein
MSSTTWKRNNVISDSLCYKCKPYSLLTFTTYYRAVNRAPLAPLQQMKSGDSLRREEGELQGAYYNIKVGRHKTHDGFRDMSSSRRGGKHQPRYVLCSNGPFVSDCHRDRIARKFSSASRSFRLQANVLYTFGGISFPYIFFEYTRGKRSGCKDHKIAQYSQIL